MNLCGTGSALRLALLKGLFLLLCLSESETFPTQTLSREVPSPACPSNISLEVYSKGEKLTSKPGQNSYDISHGEQVEIICRANTPVQLRFVGYPALKWEPRIKWKADPTSSRDGVNCFTSRIKFLAEKGFTGRYECQALEKESLQSSEPSVYIYAGGNESSVLLLEGRRIIIEAEVGQDVILPCAVSNSSVHVDLYQNGTNITEAFQFDRTLGFRAKAAEILFKSFECIVRNNREDSIQITVESRSSSVRGRELENKGLNLSMSKVKTGINFTCEGATSMTLIPCATPIQCDFYRKCVGLQGVESCKYTQSCTKQQCQTLIVDVSEHSKHSTGGILFCSNVYSKESKEFNIFINKNGEPMLKDKANSNDAMNFGVNEDPGFINYDHVNDGENVTIRCNASKYLYSQGIQWAFKVNNSGIIEETLIYQNNEGTNEVLDNVYSRTTTILFDNTQLIGIVCKAPRIDSAKYDTIDHPLEFRQSFFLKNVTLLDPSNQTVYFDPEKDNPAISCTATGKATFNWTKNGGVEFLSDSSIQHNHTEFFIDGNRHTKHSVKVPLPTLNKPDVYTCHATSLVDPVGQSREITVKLKAHTGWIPIVISVSVGFCLLVLVVVALIFRFGWRPREKRFPSHFIDKFYNGYTETSGRDYILVEESEDEEKNEGNPEPTIITYPPHSKDKEVNPKEYERMEKIGEGQFSYAFKAKHTPKGCSPSESKIVVWKEPKEKVAQDDDLFNGVIKEIQAIERVGFHENIVVFLGSMATPSMLERRKAVILMEYCALGDLEKYLNDHKRNFKNEFQSPLNSSSSMSGNGFISSYSTVEILQSGATEPAFGPYMALQNQMTTSQLLKWSHEIACALEFLTSKKIVHRDVATRNVLIDENYVAKITDFGLARYMEGDKGYYRPIVEPTKNEDGTEKRRVLLFPIPWLPIESLKTVRFSESSDIWAFGVTLWEIFSLGEKPYGETQLPYYPAMLAEYLAAGNRLPKPRAANFAMYDIMRRCWAEKPSDRPRFTELKSLLRAAESGLNQPDSGTASTAEYSGDSDSNSDNDSTFSHDINEEDVAYKDPLQ